MQGNLKPTAKGTLMTFRQWQARHLSSRDLTFGVFLLLVYLVYLYRTAPLACSTADQQHVQHLCSGNQQQRRWPLLWDLVCTTTTVDIKAGKLTDYTADTDSAPPDNVQFWLLTATLQIGPRVKAAVVSLFRLWLQVSRHVYWCNMSVC